MTPINYNAFCDLLCEDKRNRMTEQTAFTRCQTCRLSYGRPKQFIGPSHTSTALIYLIRAVHRCTTQLVAHGKWNYCVRIVIKVANFEINRGRTSLI